MPPLHAHFVRFLNAVHRRLALTRLLERVGIAILLSCGVALPIAFVLVWHSRAAMTPVLVSITCGVFAGLIWAIARQPNHLQAAIEADRQLNLDDLLSSAWIVGRRSNGADNWLSTLLAQADSRCAQASASALKLHKMGARSWGGIALAAALALTVASFGPIVAPHPSADNRRPLTATTIGLSDRAEPALLNLSSSTEHRPLLLPDPEDPNSSTLGQNSAPPSPNGKQGVSEVGNSDDHASSSASDDSHGAGSARTHAPRPGTTLNRVQQSVSAAQSNPNVGESTAGAGAPGVQASPNDTAASGAIAGLTPAGISAPPWKSAGWPTNVERARRALEIGQVPVAYRDLVRIYFTP